MSTSERIRTLLVVLAAACTGACAVAPPRHKALVAEDFMIASSDPGISLFVRNKRPEAMTTFSAEKTVLFVHGGTFPSESTFDLVVGGTSWMEYIARHGYDVYFVEVRGYGRSTRPAPEAIAAPLATWAHAQADVASAVDFIRKRRGIGRLNLIGWSLGTVRMGGYVAANPERVHKLVLYAPVWIPPAGAALPPAPPAALYRNIDVVGSRARWVQGVPADRQRDLIPAGWFEAWVAANVATDPWGATQSPQVIRVPNGPMLDNVRVRREGVAPYDATSIRAPVLVVKAEWDYETPAAMAQGLFERLVNASYKEYLEIGGGTHSVLLERNRMQLFRAVQQFLDEPGP